MSNISDETITEIISLLESRLENRLTTATFNKVKALLGVTDDEDTHVVRTDVPASGRMS
jgi:hypothetical protein